MQHDDAVYLGHMLDAATRALNVVRQTTRTDFERDDVLQAALAHFIQTIGEAARRVSPEGRAAPPGIPWRNIVGMRHRIVHDYFSVDIDVLWQTAAHNLPDLVARLWPHVPDVQ